MIDTNALRRMPLWAKGLIAFAAVALLALLALAMMPVAPFRAMIAARLSDSLGSKVTIAAIERHEWLSLSPRIAARGVRIAQPDWAGKGALLEVETISLELPVLPLLIGSVQPRAMAIDGMRANLVRTAQGRENWTSNEPGHKSRGSKRGWLSDLSIRNARFTLKDAKRELSLAGTLRSNDRGFAVDADGTLEGAPARFELRGAAIVSVDPDQPYPIRAHLRSDLLDLTAQGMTQGALNFGSAKLTLRARAPDLKHLDKVIEAGLFGTQPIDLNATVRHEGRDWFIDKIAGTIGRSRIDGKASVIKKDARTKIDGDVHFAQLDFDDLSSDAGQARAAAIRARIGPRLLPDTRINLSKMGPTDGTIRFKADRLLFKGDSVFRSLAGTLSLDHRDLRITQLVAGMVSGRMTGAVRVDHRSGAPKLSLDLAYQGATLERLIGSGEQIRGPARGRIRLAGSGDTVRAALSRADGKVSLVSSNGTVSRTAASVLGQDLGKTIGSAIGGGDERVALRCMVVDFTAKDGVLTPAPLAIDTGISVGRGTGRIVLDGETIALTIAGRARNPGALRITDPIRVAGSLSAPKISVAGTAPGKKPGVGTMLKALTKSVGAKLGIGDDGDEGAPASDARIDCAARTSAALR